MGRINRYQLRDSQHSLLFFIFFFFSFLFIEVHQRYTKPCDSLPSANEDKTYGLQDSATCWSVHNGLIASEKNSLGNNKRSDSDAVGRIPKCKVYGEYGDYYCTDENAVGRIPLYHGCFQGKCWMQCGYDSEHWRYTTYSYRSGRFVTYYQRSCDEGMPQKEAGKYCAENTDSVVRRCHSAWNGPLSHSYNRDWTWKYNRGDWN